MRDEGPYLLEWVAYHRIIGFTDFLIFTNDCSDGTAPLLNRLDELGYVRHLPNPSSFIGNRRHQVTALQYCHYHREVTDADWIISMVVDEFINAHVGDGSVKALFAAVNGAKVVSLTHLDFGDSGVENYEDFLLTERLAECDQLAPTNSDQRGVKTFVHRDSPAFRLSNLEDPTSRDIDWVDGSSRAVASSFIASEIKGLDCHCGYGLAQINHYPVRTKETYLTKSRKGNVISFDKLVGPKYWKRRNKKHARDTSIARHIPAMQDALGRLLAEPGVLELNNNAVARHREEIAGLRGNAEAMTLLDQMKSVGEEA
jgi:hypothetical protein